MGAVHQSARVRMSLHRLGLIMVTRILEPPVMAHSRNSLNDGRADSDKSTLIIGT